MKRYSTFALAVVLVMGALMLSARTAKAQAVVVRDGLCGVLAGDCATVEIIVDNGATAVVTTSGNGLTSCQATLPAGAPLPPKGAAKCDFASTGLSCGTSAGVTNDWRETVTPSGQVSLTCHLNGQP
jgi:hypothetical protein